MNNNEPTNLDLIRLNRNLQLVRVKSFYDSLSDDFSQAFFGKLVDFKIKAYQADYPHGVLPFGSHDVIGTHFVLCEKVSEMLYPLMGFKVLSSDQCEKYQLSFPPIELPREAGAIQQAEIIEKEVKRFTSSGKKVGYIGSWTIRADVRKEPLVSKLIRDISAALFARWCIHDEIAHIITFAATRFKVERFHKLLGLVPCEIEGTKLNGFNVKSFFDEPVSISMLGHSGVSQEALGLAEKFSELWNNRIEISSDEVSIKKAA